MLLVGLRDSTDYTEDIAAPLLASIKFPPSFEEFLSRKLIAALLILCPGALCFLGALTYFLF